MNKKVLKLDDKYISDKKTHDRNADVDDSSFKLMYA